MAFIPPLPGGSTNVANDLNASGVVVGYSNLDPDPVVTPYDAFRWDSATNTLTALPRFYASASFTIAYGINSSGRIVGTGEFNSDGLQRAFRWDTGNPTLTAIPVLPPFNGVDDPNTFNNFANRVNDSGNVVGLSDVSDFIGTSIFRQHAFLYLSATNTLIDIGTLGGNLGEARGINSFNEVVGFSNLVDDGPDRAFLYTQAGGIVDLNTLLDGTGAGWTLLRAEGINDDGWIVGFGLDPNGDIHAYLLRPQAIPEPATWALIGTFSAAIAARAWHRRREAQLVQEESGCWMLAKSPPSSSDAA
jgi:probable HAF family extracellular repeat protein